MSKTIAVSIAHDPGGVPAENPAYIGRLTGGKLAKLLEAIDADRPEFDLYDVAFTLRDGQQIVLPYGDPNVYGYVIIAGPTDDDGA